MATLKKIKHPFVTQIANKVYRVKYELYKVEYFAFFIIKLMAVP